VALLKASPSTWTIPHSLTLQWCWDLNSNYYPGLRGFKFRVCFNAFTDVPGYSAVRPEASEELQVCTVHWAWCWRVNSTPIPAITQKKPTQCISLPHLTSLSLPFYTLINNTYIIHTIFLHGYSSWSTRTWRWRKHNPSKYHVIFTQWPTITSQKTWIFNNTTVETSTLQVCPFYWVQFIIWYLYHCLQHPLMNK